MNMKAYIKDKFLLLLLHFVCMCFLGVFLWLTGYPLDKFCLILVVWILILSAWLTGNLLERRKYFKETKDIVDQLEKKYLLGELLPPSWRLEDGLYRELIRKSNKSVIERIRAIEQETKDYREYIESWVHEVKMPITSISLICENRRKSGEEDFRVVDLENQKIENYVDMALYFARSEEVYKDYMIQETVLSEIVYEVLSKNKRYLIANHMQAEVDCQDTVCTDGKWVAFILNQMIRNSVKYKSEQPFLKIYSEKREKCILLVLEDTGIGIREEELSRIFEKGFTGSNGRTHERATGMGLYLCKKLCGKLGIAIHAESTFGIGTRMILEFPVSTYLSKL